MVNNAVSLTHVSDCLPAVEALLFVERDRQDVSSISQRLGATDKDVRRSLIELEERYDRSDSGLELKWSGSTVWIESKHRYTQLLFSNEFTKEERSRDLIEKFLLAKELRPNTKKHYQGILYRFSGFLTVSVDAVSTEGIREFIENERRRGNKTNTIVGKINTLRSFYDWLNKEGIIVKNPLDRVDTPKETKTPPKYLTYEEIEKLRESSTGIRKVLFEVLYASGIRVSEMSGLDRSDYDPVRRELLIRNGKGGKQRTARLSTRANLILTEYLQSRVDNDPCMFRSNYKDRMSKDSIERHIRILGERAKLSRRVTPHMLRHSLATHLLDAGTPIELVQFLLGHESVKTTQVYAQTNPQNLTHYYKRVFP